MQPVDLERFRQRAKDYDASVARSADIDRFCSSSDWLLPAHDALMPARQPMLFEDGDAWITLARGTDPRGFSYLEPLEACWGLASPLVCTPPEMFLSVLRQTEWGLMLLAGFVDETETQAEMLAALSNHYDIHAGEKTRRYVIDLAGGVDAFLGRRSRNFRRSLARARRRANAAGIRFEVADDLDAETALSRIALVDQRSWKGLSGQGLMAAGLFGFYREMIPRLAARGALRLRFARSHGRDVAFILGGIFANSYRGCQFGFDADYRHLGLGNLCQLEQMVALCEEGVTTYDLGTTSEHYKRRWSDALVESSMFFVVNAS